MSLILKAPQDKRTYLINKVNTYNNIIMSIIRPSNNSKITTQAIGLILYL